MTTEETTFGDQLTAQEQEVSPSDLDGCLSPLENSTEEGYSKQFLDVILLQMSHHGNMIPQLLLQALHIILSQ